MTIHELQVRCHCRNVVGTFLWNDVERKKLVAWDCNCSDCFLRKNTHIVVPKEDLILEDDKKYESETILYQWGTKTAIRRFCKTCGILPWYQPRSNPDGYAITLQCIDWSSLPAKPEVEIRQFDGMHWEESYAASNIARQSRPSA